MVNTYLYNAITVWYGIASPYNQYIASECVVTSEIPNQVSCRTVPGVVSEIAAERTGMVSRSRSHSLSHPSL